MHLHRILDVAVTAAKGAANIILLASDQPKVVDHKGKTFLRPTSVDDDNIATYIISKNANPKFVSTPAQKNLTATSSPINGPLGSTIEFKVFKSEFIFLYLTILLRIYNERNNCLCYSYSWFIGINRN